jgi:hypothetical protein
MNASLCTSASNDGPSVGGAGRVAVMVAVGQPSGIRAYTISPLIARCADIVHICAVNFTAETGANNLRFNNLHGFSLILCTRRCALNVTSKHRHFTDWFATLTRAPVPKRPRLHPLFAKQTSHRGKHSCGARGTPIHLPLPLRVHSCEFVVLFSVHFFELARAWIAA